MILISVNNKTLGLSFAHPKVDDALSQRKTVCKLFAVDGENATLLGQNEAACSKSDNFNRAVGRKLALARVICQHEFIGTSRCLKCGSVRVSPLPFSKDTRRQIWNGYFDAIFYARSKSATLRTS